MYLLTTLLCMYFVKCEICQILGFFQGFVRVSFSGLMWVMLGYVRVVRVSGTPRSAGAAGGNSDVGGSWTSGRFGRRGNLDVTVRRGDAAGNFGSQGDAAVGGGHRRTPRGYLDPLFQFLGTCSNFIFHFGTSLHIAYRPVPPGSHRYVPMFQHISY